MTLHEITKTYLLILLIISLFIWQTACNRAVKREHTSEAIYDEQDDNTYLSVDGTQTFRVQTKDSVIQIKAEHLGEVITLKKVPSGSGVKYQNDEGYFFWTKGLDFMWGKGQVTLAKGQLVAKRKISGAFDLDQIDKTSYSKTLAWNKLTFLIQVKEERLSIKPSGLEINDQVVIHEFDGVISDAEIGDLNNDNYPEILVYITSFGSGSYGSIIGYSVNNEKSMSQIYLPDLSGNPEISEGYMGHDKFAIVEDTFVQRFPIYNPEDSNAKPTGGTRQIQYQLVDGEASRVFTVDKVVEY